MSLKDTFKQMRELLANITLDIEKSENGNKAASQRVRTGTVRLEKIAKLFRKESIASEKKNKGQKKSSRSAGGASKSKSGGSHGIGSHGGSKSRSGTGGSSKGRSGGSHGGSKSKSASVKAKPKAKAAQASIRPRQLSVKRATAKLPTKRLNFR